METVDFVIISRPSDICFRCPHCEVGVTIPFNKVKVPIFWVDDWGIVECPNCWSEVELGDWTYD